MKIIPRNLLFFLIGCALIGFLALPPLVSVGAQVLATITATQTFIPPSPTATGFAKSCPVGTPAGWGTYTPSPLWGLECGACASIQGTGTPTQTVIPWIGTGTPPVGCTPFPSGTGTPSAGCVSPTRTATIAPTSTSLPSSGWYFNGDYPCTTPVAGTFNYCKIDGNNKLLKVTYVFVNNVWDVQGKQGTVTAIDPSSSSQEHLHIYATLLTNPTMAIGTGAALLKDVATLILDQDRNLMADIGFIQWAHSASFSFILSIDTPYVIPVATSTPTPTATPYYDGGYCSTIAPPLSDFGFDLFVPSGVANCSLGWDAFTAGTIEVPAVKICFQPSEFGVIKLFGADYEIGIIALAAAAAFIWRFMRTV